MELTQLKHSAEEVQAREHACSVEAACLVDARLVGHILCRGRMLSRCTPNGTHTHTLSRARTCFSRGTPEGHAYSMKGACSAEADLMEHACSAEGPCSMAEHQQGTHAL